MCGILGTVNRFFDESTLDLLQHRGPDDSAITQSIVGDHLVTLGHRRLAIVDLSPAGHQPMSTPGDKHSIVFNGEVYNHQDLRNSNHPVNYRGHSDTETILHTMARHGVHAAAQFNGIFAFAFLDVQQRMLYLARDPFGVKPLYYWADSGSFVFSSELRPLREFVDDTIDPANLAQLLRLRYVPAPDTLFKRIMKVRPGHIVEVDLGAPRLSFREYPFTRPASGDAPVKSRAEALDRYGVLLEQAVKRQLMSDVQIGILLSGGVDSAVVASIAQQHVDYRMKAFTVGFSEQADADEIDDAAGTARALGLDHQVVRVGLPEFLDLMPRISAMIEEPLATASVVPMYYLSSLVSKHVKVALSGQGADEAMGGYRRYRMELLRSYIPRFAIPALVKGAALAGVRNDAVLRGLDSIGEPDDVRRFESALGVFSPEQIVRLIGHEAGRATERIRYFFDLLQCSRQRHSAERMMSLDLRMNLADDLLLYTDKITMRHSFECRVPLLDLDLVRFMESLPCNYRLGLVRGGKALHKAFARRILPPSIVGRKKKGFLAPVKSWFKATGALRDILLDRNSRFASHFNLVEVEKILNEQAAGMNRERHIFLLLSLYYWMSDSLGRGARPRRSAIALSV